MHVSSSHIRNACLAYRLVCGSRQFLLDRYFIMEETEHIRGAGDRSSKQFDFHRRGNLAMLSGSWKCI